MLPGTAMSGFERALREKDVDAAFACAAQLPGLSLDRALRLTLLLADRWDPRYQAAARRFLVRFTVECETHLLQVKRLADALAHVHDERYGPFARRGLYRLVGKLRRREDDLWVEFDSRGNDT